MDLRIENVKSTMNLKKKKTTTENINEYDKILKNEVEEKAKDNNNIFKKTLKLH